MPVQFLLLTIGLLTVLLLACDQQTPPTTIASDATGDSIEIIDSRGKVSFDTRPTRVISINWTLTEQLLDLDITPVAVAEAYAYRAQIQAPTLPNTVIDIGPRNQPDLLKIKALNPEVILLGHGQKHLLRTLSNLAPVVYFKNFSHRYHNAKHAREIYLKLAKLFNRQSFAEQQLDAMQMALNTLALRANTLFPDTKPDIVLMTPDERRSDHVWVFLPNSMADYALQSLNLKNALTAPPSKFGFERQAIQSLPQHNTCYLYTTQNPPQHSSLDEDDKRCIGFLAPSSFYGGALSIERLATAILATLDAIMPHQTL